MEGPRGLGVVCCLSQVWTRRSLIMSLLDVNSLLYCLRVRNSRLATLASCGAFVCISVNCWSAVVLSYIWYLIMAMHLLVVACMMSEHEWCCSKAFPLHGGRELLQQKCVFTWNESCMQQFARLVHGRSWYRLHGSSHWFVRHVRWSWLLVVLFYIVLCSPRCQGQVGYFPAA